MEYMIQTNSLTKTYGNKKVVNQVSICVGRGDIYGLIGKNGAGKTTLIKMLLGLTSPSAGQISLLGEADPNVARRRIGSLVEAPALYKNETAYENMKRFGILSGATDEEIRQLLAFVGLADTGKKKAGAFSLGMKQRLGIAIALLGNTIYHTPRQPETFRGYAVSADVMEFKMCKTPSYSGWDHYDISEYTTTFKTGQKASFVIRMRAEYNTSDDEITAAFVVRNADGQVVEASSSTEAWWRMWRRNYCELDVPSLPTAPGDYTVSVYFNGDLAAVVDITIIE